MARTKAYTVKQVEKAIRASAGVIAMAARKLGCSRQTVENYIDQHEELQVVKAEVREDILDLCDAKLIENIRSGNMTAIIWYQKTMGKERGYTERHEHTGKGGKELPPVVVNVHADIRSSPETG